MLKKDDLREYQKRLVNEIKNNNKLLLAVDMGLGKTISCATAIEELQHELSRVLIVAPLRVAHTTWPDEFNTWEHLKNISYTVIKGNEKQRLKCMENDTLVYIINRENIPWLLSVSDVNSFDMIIWDESSSLKSGKMKTAKGELSRFGALCHFTANTDRVILLTGTPTPNGLEDIWGQIKALNPKDNILEKSKNKFLEKYFRDISRVRDYRIWEPLRGSYEEVMSLVDHLIIKMKSDDYITLPDFMPIVTNVDLDTKTRKIYKELSKDFITDDIIAGNPAVLVNKLLQLASGCVYKEDGSYNYYHSEKIDALKDLIEENTNDNILVFYNFQHEKEQLKKNFKDIRFIETEKDIKDWQAGKIKMLACHPASAGHGLNLQGGGSLMVWFSLPWSLELYQQANKRLHRSGQKNTVRCYHIITKETVDEYVLAVLQGKDDQQEMIMRLMKELK